MMIEQNMHKSMMCTNQKSFLPLYMDQFSVLTFETSSERFHSGNMRWYSPLSYPIGFKALMQAISNMNCFSTS